MQSNYGKAKIDMKPANVLILFSYASNKLGDYDSWLSKINERAADFGYKAARGALKELEFSITNNQPSVYDGMNKCDLASYDLVYYRMWHKEFERATAAAMYLQTKAVPFFDNDAYSDRAFSKLTENFLFVTSGIPVVDSFFSTPKRVIERFKMQPPFQFPIIVKSINGLKGRNNHLVSSLKELQAVFATSPTNPDISFIVQRFVPNDCDYRFLTLGDEIKLIIRRTRQNTITHVNNTSQGAKADLMKLEDFSEEIRQDALRAARVTRRDFSGVDVIIDKDTGCHYILEVNSVPEVASVFIEEKLDAFHSYIASRIRA